MLSLRAYEDLWMWRVILQLGFNDRRWTVVPIRVPLLLRYLPKEDAVHHMHIWTDDKSCLSWMTINRSHHPLHLYLLQVATFLNVTYHVTVTMGHVPGVVSISADAASRKLKLCQ